MVVIACLHTADSNIAVFDAALAGLGAPGVELRHQVRADLLTAAEAAGGLTPGVVDGTRDALRNLARGAGAVLLTCSTLGPAVDGLGAAAPVLRVDAALAEEAVRDGGRVVALCAVATTLQPTRDLFVAAARGVVAVEVRLVPGAWDAFKAGDTRGYWRMVARAADAAAGEGARVALAQASMAGAAELARCRALTSPAAGLRAAVAAAQGAGVPA